MKNSITTIAGVGALLAAPLPVSALGKEVRKPLRTPRRTFGPLTLVTLVLATFGSATTAWAQDLVPDKGDTAWMLTCTALVLLMSVPALALFYGGLVAQQEHAVGAHASIRHVLAGDGVVVRLRVLAGVHDGQCLLRQPRPACF